MRFVGKDRLRNADFDACVLVTLREFGKIITKKKCYQKIQFLRRLKCQNH